MAIGATTLVGPYRVLDRLGAGGMGEVYRAVDTRTNRLVALKIILSHMADPSFVTRFMNEARILATVRHPNVVSFVDFLEFEGNPCLVMEYVEGRMLAEILQERGRFDIDTALAIVEALGNAVAYLHSRGIVHRDLKPSNVLLTPRNEVKLLDFGIAKGGATPKLTMTGAAIGTFEYMSPERLRGAEAEPSTDVWALGAIFYELLTGSSPFASTSVAELCGKIAKAAYVRPSAFDASIPSGIERIITRCLKKQPRDRYPTANELIDEVQHLRALHRPAGAAPRASWSGTIPVPAMRPRPPIMLVVACVSLSLVVVLAIAGYLLSGSAAMGVASGKADGQICTIRIETYGTTGARVLRAGEVVGVTPCEIKARDGEQIRLVIEQDGYATLEVPPIKVSRDEVKSFTLERSK